MSQAHLSALKKKHEDIEKKIHEETARPAWNESLVRKMKEEKLHIKEEIERLQKTGAND